MMAQTEREMVRFELPEYVRVTRDVFDGAEMTVEYDSRFGGTQTVEGTAEQIREWENGRRRRYMVVDDRRISGGYVFSDADGRVLGEVESIEVVAPFEPSLDVISRDWNGYDVDRHTDHDEIYVQFWSGELHDEMSSEEWMNHTDAIRFQKQ